MRFRFFAGLACVSILMTSILVGCDASDSTPFNSNAFNSTGSKHLYVAAGSCYAGGATVSVGPSNTIVKYSLSGAFEQVVIDYNQLAPGDSPVSISDYDSETMLVLVENPAGRRIDRVRKDGAGFSTYIVSATGLSAVLRSIVMLPDFSILVSKSSAVEKFNSSKSRVLSGANPFINAPAAPCATSTTLISSAIVDPIGGKIVYTHAAASPNNRIGVINSTGYSIAADCNSGTAGPVTTALPTRALFHSSGKLLVAYGSATATSNFIYSYDFNSATGAVTNPIAAFTDFSIVNGPSSMTEDTETGDVFVANATGTFNTIERLRLVGTAMSRVGVQPFVPYTAYTRCVSDLKVMD